MNWQTAKLLKSEMISRDIKSLTFSVPDWKLHISGQYYEIRVKNKNGVVADRPYSVASAPEQHGIVEFGVQLLEDGEVSPRLFELRPGDEVELRIDPAEHFVWRSNMPGPLILIGGGSGMVPLMSMLRHHFNNYQPREVVFLVSVPTSEDVLYKRELEAFAAQHSDFKLIIAYTREAPVSWNSYGRRIDKLMLLETIGQLADKFPNIYVCGSTPFVESVTQNLLILGFDFEHVFTERFG